MVRKPQINRVVFTWDDGWQVVYTRLATPVRDGKDLAQWRWTLTRPDRATYTDIAWWNPTQTAANRVRATGEAWLAKHHPIP